MEWKEVFSKAIIPVTIIICFSILVGALLYEDLHQSPLEECFENCHYEKDYTQTEKCKERCMVTMSTPPTMQVYNLPENGNYYVTLPNNGTYYVPSKVRQ